MRQEELIATVFAGAALIGAVVGCALLGQALAVRVSCPSGVGLVLGGMAGWMCWLAGMCWLVWMVAGAQVEAERRLVERD